MLIARQSTTVSQQPIDFFWRNGYVSPRPRRCPIGQYFAPPTRFQLASGDAQPNLPFGERLVTE
jgi:hypothetical protein